MSPAEFHESGISPSELQDAHDFWDDIILNEDGTVNMKNVYTELHDYERMMENASQVYYHITCGLMSSPNYYARDVIQQSDECVDDTIRREVHEVLTSIQSPEQLQALIEEYKTEEKT